MILYRHNGEAICLTSEEMREIYEEVRRADMRQDIEFQMEELKIAPITDADVAKVAADFDRILSHDGAYHEAYWAAAETAVKEWRDQHVH